METVTFQLLILMVSCLIAQWFKHCWRLLQWSIYKIRKSLYGGTNFENIITWGEYWIPVKSIYAPTLNMFSLLSVFRDWLLILLLMFLVWLYVTLNYRDVTVQSFYFLALMFVCRIYSIGTASLDRSELKIRSAVRIRYSYFSQCIFMCFWHQPWLLSEPHHEKPCLRWFATR